MEANALQVPHWFVLVRWSVLRETRFHYVRCKEQLEHELYVQRFALFEFDGYVISTEDPGVGVDVERAQACNTHQAVPQYRQRRGLTDDIPRFRVAFMNLTALGFAVDVLPLEFVQILLFDVASQTTVLFGSEVAGVVTVGVKRLAALLSFFCLTLNFVVT